MGTYRWTYPRRQVHQKCVGGRWRAWKLKRLRASTILNRDVAISPSTCPLQNARLNGRWVSTHGYVTHLYTKCQAMGSSRKSDTVHLARHHSTLRIKARVLKTVSTRIGMKPWMTGWCPNPVVRYTH